MPWCLINVGMEDICTVKTRWAKASYVWNKKGLLYKRYQHLANWEINRGTKSGRIRSRTRSWGWIGNHGKRPSQQRVFHSQGSAETEVAEKPIAVRLPNGKFIRAKDIDATSGWSIHQYRPQVLKLILIYNVAYHQHAWSTWLKPKQVKSLMQKIKLKTSRSIYKRWQ